MNWSGGYKHRFRPSTEIRKTAFQQQSRIILVDLVRDDDHEKANENNGQNFPMIPPKVTTNLMAVNEEVLKYKYFTDRDSFKGWNCNQTFWNWNSI